MCVTQPGPSRPRRHDAEGQVFLVFFQVAGCHTDTETCREPIWKELKPQSSVHEALGVSPELALGASLGEQYSPPFHLLCPPKEQLHLWGVSQGQISPKKGWLFL